MAVEDFFTSREIWATGLPEKSNPGPDLAGARLSGSRALRTQNSPATLLF
jgi:hypothetical protein